MREDNPFYDNHVFKKEDINRAKFSYWKYPILWFKPTCVQITTDGIFYYKIGNDGAYYIIKYIPPNRR